MDLVVSGPQAPIRDPDLYFEDGSVAISGMDPSTTSLTYFRLHKSILAKHSQIFHDLFAIPTPSGADQYDGVPLVSLPDDPKDLKIFFGFLYDPIAFAFGSEAVDIAFSLYGVLILADKYLVHRLKNIILRHIKREWPTTLVAWDQRDEFIQKSHRKSLGVGDASGVGPDYAVSDSASILRVAHRFDPSLVPTLYYDLCRLPILMTYRGIDSDGRRGYRRFVLTREDLDMLALGRERLSKWTCKWWDYVTAFACQRSTNTGRPVRRRCREELTIAWFRIVEQVLINVDPLQALSDGRGYPPPSMCGTVCPDCEKRWVGKLEELRRDLFESLHRIFSFEPHPID